MMASPERDKPRSLQQHYSAGTNVPPYRTAKTVTRFSLNGKLLVIVNNQPLAVIFPV
jgi:hypothetical protein